MDLRDEVGTKMRHLNLFITEQIIRERLCTENTDANKVKWKGTHKADRKDGMR